MPAVKLTPAETRATIFALERDRWWFEDYLKTKDLRDSVVDRTMARIKAIDSAIEKITKAINQ